jgi:hypothetical protein
MIMEEEENILLHMKGRKDRNAVRQRGVAQFNLSGRLTGFEGRNQQHYYQALTTTYFIVLRQT